MSPDQPEADGVDQHGRAEFHGKRAHTPEKASVFGREVGVAAHWHAGNCREQEEDAPTAPRRHRRRRFPRRSQRRAKIHVRRARQKAARNEQHIGGFLRGLASTIGEQGSQRHLGYRVAVAFERDAGSGKFNLHVHTHIMYPAVQPPSTASTWPLM